MRFFRRLALLSLPFCILAFARAEKPTTLPKPLGYINDYAAVFTPAAESQMESLCKEIHTKTKAQVFIVTLKTLGDDSVEQYSNNLFHTWKIGEKKTDRGILILFAIKEHKYRIEVGYGFEGILNDAKAGDIGRTMVPDLRAGNYDGAAQLSLNAVAQIIADDAHITLDNLAPPPSPAASPLISQPASDSPSQNSDDKFFWVFFISIWVFVITVIILAFIFTRRRGSRSGGFSSSRSYSSDSPSSSDSSSSDDSFSGGDGGDSGGGGASGSW